MLFQQALESSIVQAASITLLAFAMMVIVDFADAITRGKIGRTIKGGRLRQYITASFLGATPGCLGVFMDVSFYLRGLISFGSVAGGMAATSGDAAFVMLAMFPKAAMLLFAILFVIGVVWAFLLDKLVSTFKIETCRECEESASHEAEACCSARHYLKVHVWGHIARRHLWKIFLWSLGAMMIVRWGTEVVDLSQFVSSHMVWVLLIAVAFGIIPDSGPQVIFVVLFAKGIIPFSVLLASSVAQSGHGILPLLSHSVRDSVMIKAFNLALGLVLGVAIYLLGA